MLRTVGFESNLASKICANSAALCHHRVSPAALCHHRVWLLRQLRRAYLVVTALSRAINQPTRQPSARPSNRPSNNVRTLPFVLPNWLFLLTRCAANFRVLPAEFLKYLRSFCMRSLWRESSTRRRKCRLASYAELTTPPRDYSADLSLLCEDSSWRPRCRRSSLLYGVRSTVIVILCFCRVYGEVRVTCYITSDKYTYYISLWYEYTPLL